MKIRKVIGGFLLILFLGSSFLLGFRLFSYYGEKREIQSLRESLETFEPVVREIGEKGGEEEEKVQEHPLQSKNKDYQGWLSIEGTRVDYPVMYSKEEAEYYLHRNFEKKYQLGGLPFLDKDCENPTKQQHLVIYGHNMKDGSMFADLMKYKDRKFWEENSLISIEFPEEKRWYRIFAVVLTADTKEGLLYRNYAGSSEKEELSEFIAQACSLSLYDTGVEAGWEDQLLTLSTCEYSRREGRLIVVAKEEDVQ